jgi:hypothetical protein
VLAVTRGENPSPELPLRHWQGDESSAADCSAAVKLSRHGDDLYALVRVTDEHRRAGLAQDDVKRHWRTDSGEIALDLRGAGCGRHTP